MLLEVWVSFATTEIGLSERDFWVILCISKQTLHQCYSDDDGAGAMLLSDELQNDSTKNALLGKNWGKIGEGDVDCHQNLTLFSG